MYALQLMEQSDQQDAVCQMLSGCSMQIDYKGGRTYYDPGMQVWRMQAFFKDADVSNTLLPDGMRRVYIMDSHKTMLGIVE